MDKRSSRDFLSNLPLSIIHTILELLPVREAVHTSILSRQWRYRWATLPHLSFEENSVENSETELKDFITQLLLLHQGPILKFKLYLEGEAISLNLNAWLTFLARNSLTILILNLTDNYCERLSSVYSCQNLTNLELSHCVLPQPPPTFKGFLCLRRLKLKYVGATSNTIQSLLTDFTLLEELRLLEVYEYVTLEACFDLKINAPNLKILELECVFQDICLYAPLLREMHVDFTEHVTSRKNMVCTLNELLGGLTFLEKLKGGLYFFEYLSIGIESCHTLLVFPHLRLIELSPETFYDKNMESVIAHICKGAPNLNKIGISYMYADHPRLPSLHLDSECLFNFTFRWLKVIEFEYLFIQNSVGGINRWMKLIKCLLARSPALETLICLRPRMSDGQLLEQASTLLAYPRASPNAKIVYRKI